MRTATIPRQGSDRQPARRVNPGERLAVEMRRVSLPQSVESEPEECDVLPAANQESLQSPGGANAAPLATWQTPEHALIALLKRIAQADEQAMAALYDATSPLVYAFACRILRNHSAAEDVLIEVYTQVYQQASQYDPRRGTPLAWLLTLTRSRALDRHRLEVRQQQRHAPLALLATLPARTPDPEASSAAGELWQVIQNALATLNPEQRQVIDIAYYEGCSHSEIAARVGRPLGTVKTQLRLGMLALRRLLQPVLTEDWPCSLPH